MHKVACPTLNKKPDYNRYHPRPTVTTILSTDYSPSSFVVGFLGVFDCRSFLFLSNRPPENRNSEYAQTNPKSTESRAIWV